MMIKIRYAAREDVDDLVVLDRIAHKEFLGWTIQHKKDFYSILKRNNKLILIALLDEEIVGYLQANLDKDRNWTWLENIYVLKDIRKRCIAKKLIKIWTSYWINKVDTIVLLSPDRNLPIFSEFGFKKTMNFMEYFRGKK